MADITPRVTSKKWQKLIPVSMEVDADLIDIWAAADADQDDRNADSNRRGGHQRTTGDTRARDLA